MQRPMTNTRREMTMPGMTYMVPMEDFAQYQFMQKVPEYWLQPPPIYDARQFYPAMMVPQMMHGPIRRRRKYRLVPNYPYVYM
ncbi:hypothetical protein B9Z55_005406 [Caenorhabditis nigoni]|nr:hypothetical protein B9Z55_005406 [Caenorhabditis nigoni]